MLMLNLIERLVFHDAFHIQKLYDEHAIIFQPSLDALADRMQFLEVKEDSGSIDDVVLLADVAHGFLIEERV